MATANEWRDRVKEWRASGKTASEFCAQQGLKTRQLNTWAWKLGMTSNNRAAPVDAPMKIVKLVPRSKPATRAPAGGGGPESSRIRIVAAGVSVEVHSGFDCGLLLDVLAVLAQRGEIQR